MSHVDIRELSQSFRMLGRICQSTSLFNVSFVILATHCLTTSLSPFLSHNGGCNGRCSTTDRTVIHTRFIHPVTCSLAVLVGTTYLTQQDRPQDPLIIRPQRPEYRSTATGSRSPAMRGLSCVSLLDHKTWRQGSKEYAVIFKGVRYWLTGPEELAKFRQNPTRYAPAAGGDCIVTWIEKGMPRAGKTQHTALYRQKIYLFANQEAKDKFMRQPHYYVSAAAGSVSSFR